MHGWGRTHAPTCSTPTEGAQGLLITHAGGGGGGVPFTQSPQELMEALEEEAMALEIHVCVRAF